jgi:3-methyladenine DNA glycosylase/8-oxoguanine DNA glycosylase
MSTRAKASTALRKGPPESEGDRSLEATRVLSRADPVLGRLIARVGPYALVRHQLHNPYESLAESILHQQVHGKAAAAILARVRAHFQVELFPSPEQVRQAPMEDLRSLGLSRSKALAVKDLAEKAHAGLVPDAEALKTMSDEAIVEALTPIRGIGRWTVEMMLVFQLGRDDVLPASDYGVRAGFARVFRKKELPTPKQVLERGERWRPYRTVASWYLWRANELPRRNR